MPKPPPASVLSPPGLIGEIAKWIDDCAVHPAPLLSVAAALSTVCTLAGRRYATKTGMRPCTYVVGVAGSGVGKEAGRQCSMSILDLCGVPERIGTGGIASGAGLVARLVECPTQLFYLDEFGRLLAAFTSKNAGNHEREIMTTFLSLWGASSGLFKGKAYAERDTPVIQQPHTVMYGTTTPDAFYGALRGSDATDGVLSRMIVMEVDHGQLDEVDPKASSAEPPESILQKAKLLTRGVIEGNLGGVETSAMRVTPTLVTVSPEAHAFARKISLGLTVQLGRVEHKDLWVRAKEQTMRVAMAVALGCGRLQIELTDIKWAWALVRWSVTSMDDEFNSRVAETDEGRARLSILAAIKEAGGAISARDLARSKHVRKVDARLRKTALGLLFDEGRIVSQDGPPASNGRSLTQYVLACDDESDIAEEADTVRH